MANGEGLVDEFSDGPASERCQQPSPGLTAGMTPPSPSPWITETLEPSSHLQPFSAGRSRTHRRYKAQDAIPSLHLGASSSHGHGSFMQHLTEAMSDTPVDLLQLHTTPLQRQHNTDPAATDTLAQACARAAHDLTAAMQVAGLSTGSQGRVTTLLDDPDLDMPFSSQHQQQQAPLTLQSPPVLGSPVVQCPRSSLHALGLQYQAMMDKRDADAVQSARSSGTTLVLTIQVYQVPDEMDTLTLPSVDLEVPASCTLAYLKRAVCRMSGGRLHPHAQRYYVATTGEVMRGDSNSLSCWQLSPGSLLYLSVQDHEPSDSLSVPQVTLDHQGHQPWTQPAVRPPVVWAHHVPYRQQAPPGADPQEAAEEGRDGAAEGVAGDSGPDTTGRRKRARSTSTGRGGGAGSGSDQGGGGGGGDGAWLTGAAASQSRQRFTEEEIVAVVEGVRLYGTSWARIKAAFAAPLARRTQLNIKDKWRNLQRGLLNNWENERSPLSEETKERIRELTETLNMHQAKGTVAEDRQEVAMAVPGLMALTATGEGQPEPSDQHVQALVPMAQTGSQMDD